MISSELFKITKYFKNRNIPNFKLNLGMLVILLKMNDLIVFYLGLELQSFGFAVLKGFF